MSPELGRRIAFTLGALLVYRIGSNIPLPGIDVAAWFEIFGPGRADLMTTALAGGSLHRVAICALGILPYLTAAILVQIATAFWPSLRALSQQGQRGRKQILFYTRVLTLAMTAFQALAIAHGLEGLHGVVPNPGALFELSTVLTLTAGTMLLVWIADQITERGVGNGIALIFAAGIVAGLPGEVAAVMELGRQGLLTNGLILGAFVMMVVMIAIVALFEGARRRIMIDYPQRDIGGRAIDSVSAPLSLKLNNAGVMPAFIANWFIFVPAVIMSFALGTQSGWGRAIYDQLSYGRPLFMILFCALIVAFTLVYTAFLLDPERVGETLKTLGGSIRGVAPGEPAVEYFDSVVSRTTIIGGLYLAFVLIVPETLSHYFAVPLLLGGQAFLIVVCAIMDVATQYKQQMQLQPGGYRR